MTDRRERGRELLFLLLFGMFLFLWAVIQPFNVSPDEPMRYRICQYLYENHTLPPHGGDPSIRDAAWGYSYAFFPILPQTVGAFFMTVASWFSKDAFVLLMAARMVSVASGVVTAWFSLRIGEKLWGRTALKWLFTVLVTMLPQFVFLCSYVNSDSFAVMATSVIIYSWLLGMESGWSYRNCITMAIGIILCAMCYYDAYGVILASILVVCVSLLRQWKDRRKRLELIKKVLLIAGLVLLGIAWWFIRNAVLYQGDFLGLATSEEYSQQFAADNLKPSNRYLPYHEGASLWDMLLSWGWIKVAGISFIGCFGYVSIPLKIWMYVIYAAVIVIGVGATLWHLIIQIRRKRNQLREKAGAMETKADTAEAEAGIAEAKDGLPGTGWQNRVWIAALLITSIIPNLLNLYHSYYVDFQPQGRYSMPMLLPLMYFVTLGWQYIAKGTEAGRDPAAAAQVDFSTGKHRKYRRWIAPCLGIVWLALTVFIYLTIYYPATVVAISSR